jgi:DNA/RNA-binding domain of Phe-tRNA-synthetase-like protein
VGSQVRTRRWTWRQSEHGKIEAGSSYVFFPIDGFAGFNDDRVRAAMAELKAALKASFGCETVSGFVDRDHPEMDITL